MNFIDILQMKTSTQNLCANLKDAKYRNYRSTGWIITDNKLPMIHAIPCLNFCLRHTIFRVTDWMMILGLFNYAFSNEYLIYD